MFGTYIAATTRYQYERLRTTSNLIIILHLALWVVIGVFFWNIGQQPASNLSLFPFFFLVMFFYGVWIGLRFINAHRPNGLYFIEDDQWLWFQLVKGLLIGLGVTTISFAAYYISSITQLNLPPLLLAAYIFNLYAFAAVIMLIGSFVALLTRRLSTNVFVRFVLLILVSFFALYLTGLYQQTVINFEGRIFLSPINQIILPFLVVVVVALLVILLLNQTIIAFTPISQTPEPTIWNGIVSLKIFRLSNRPAFQAGISNLLYIVRSNYFQRRIFSLLILFILFPYLVTYLNLTTGSNLVDAIMLGAYCVAFAVSLGAGHQAFDEYQTYKYYPRSRSLQPTVGFIVSGIIVVLLTLLLISVTVQGLTIGDWLITFAFALASHTILFFAGNLAEIANQLPSTETREGDQTVALGIIASLILVSIAWSSYGHLSNYLSLPLVVVWAGAAVFFLYFANRHFLNDIE